ISSLNESGDVNLDLFRLRFLRFRQSDRQDTVTVIGRDFIGVDLRRQRNATSEFADVTLGALSFVPFRSLALALTIDGQHSVVQGNFDVFLTHTWQLDPGDDVVVVLVKVECGRPTAKKLRLPAEIRPKRHLKQGIQLVAQIAQAIESTESQRLRWLISDNTHMCLFLLNSFPKRTFSLENASCGWNIVSSYRCWTS